MATFRLNTKPETAGPEAESGRYGLGSDILYHNAIWFIGVRWFVTGLFVAAGLLSLVFRDALRRGGIVPPSVELLVLAGLLGIANTVFILLKRRYYQKAADGKVKAYLWAQIIFDLFIVSGAVYFIGSTETFLAFTYLFHIVLACIFFPRRESFIVTALAAVMFISTVVMEILGVLPDRMALAGTVREVVAPNHMVDLLHMASAILVWFIVWYLVSTISESVRSRDLKLQIMNERLIRADQEKNQQMLITTHDLKAPFSGIESNIEVLTVRYWDALPPEVQDIVNRIERRSENLRQRINAILLLGELRSYDSEKQVKIESVEMKELLGQVCSDLEDRCQKRAIAMQCDMPALYVQSNRKRLIILFSNIISNAGNYSFDNGTVEIKGEVRDGKTVITVSDNGIGIRQDALPHIFDEFYRSREAAKFNKSSTGLGLAIVKEIARQLSLEVVVESAEGAGTSISIGIPEIPPSNDGGEADV
ncbi:MAG: hypothetical protein E4H36_00835 [Spirochaetales bacterium]|nr:MAG: hypothetical protein E4H36_00835 [Spirochaetales bacterium]